MEITRLTLITATIALSGCSAPSVNLSTPEPIKVDISMRLDVYQYNSSTNSAKPTPQPSANPESRRRNRMADIQEFKNARIIGEGRDGLVVIRANPEGDYGDYVRKTVSEENTDRMELMKLLADQQKTSLPEIQKQQADLWRKRSFKGELIEIPEPDGAWVWVPKEG
jgi:uncharacterized protein YdbL (DUF1318 family)